MSRLSKLMLQVWACLCVAQLAQANDAVSVKAGKNADTAAVRARALGESAVEWVKTPRAPLTKKATPESPAGDAAEVSGEWQVLLSDRTFYQTMLRWTRQAGWQLVWEAERDFAIDAQVSLQGTFLQVLDISMRSLLNTDYPLQAQINEQTRVVRITRYLIDGDRR